MYSGEKVKLREYKKEDIRKAQKYMNDPEIKKLLNSNIPYPITFEDEERWYESLGATKDTYNFAIETLEDNQYIGGCGINKIDWKNSVVIIGIFIGDKEYWNKGYGTDAINILIRFIFEQMNIRKIKLQVFSFNERAIRAYEKCGFKREGVLRQEIFRDGRYHDEIIMGLLRQEYY
ncbi:GNAT family N-acetyltransferase [Clostridium senegalense]|uniref:GNAT family N-acetyltransferase n=1 Tax=Clostridium senegalense TaxID=1465809 RepID=UPI001C1020A3|nr:GNAT family protein [Clostridium senegalense]MBU5227275.1 GNAT family N-acetyltransferase [Clostridium senegalense]